MELFRILPERLFSVLASPAKAVYAHLLFLIYDLQKQELYGTPREAIIDAAAAYIEAEAITDAELEPEDGPPLSPRDRANALLRRLAETGWLEIEQRTDYQQYINLADYAIAILDTLDRLRRGERTEYAGYVLATYVALTSDEAQRNPGLAIGKAFEQTGLLVRDLKSLHQNIKRYTEQLLHQQEPREILALHFGDYKLEVLDRAYHRLKTTDNVSKFRPRILERIDLWLADPQWLAIAAEGEVRRGRQPDLGAAEEALQAQLTFIRNSYLQMDDLLDEIDRRNAQYAKASFEHVRYLLSQSEDVEGHLVDLLQSLARRLNTGALGVEDLWPAEGDPLFAFGSVQTLEESSILSPRALRRTHQPQPLEAPSLPPAQREAALAKARQRLARTLTHQRVDQYLQAQMGDRSELRAGDLPIETVADFVRLIYIAAYGRSRRVGYMVELTGPQTTAGDGRFRFKNIRIRRK